MSSNGRHEALPLIAFCGAKIRSGLLAPSGQRKRVCVGIALAPWLAIGLACDHTRPKERPLVACLFGDINMSASIQKPRPTSALPQADTRSWTSSEDSADGQTHPRQLDAWREAVGLWLNWNLAYEQVTERLFALGQDQGKLEEVMDQMDQVRLRAVRLSQQLVE